MKRSFPSIAACIPFIAIAFMAPASVLPASSEVKIGIIDTQKILVESKAAKNERTLFLKDLETKKGVYRSRELDVQKMQEELKAQASDLTEAKRKEKIEEIEKDVKELGRLKTDLEEELKKKELELTRALLQEIGDIVKQFSLREKYTLILEKKSVITSDDAVDVTDKVLKLYDAGKK
jgi:outer membrane protein